MHPVEAEKKGIQSPSRSVPQIYGALAVQVALCNWGESDVFSRRTHAHKFC
jgi:hypothetical protein